MAQTPAQEAAAAAAAANITIQGFISTPSAAAVVPSYTATPPQSLYSRAARPEQRRHRPDQRLYAAPPIRPARPTTTAIHSALAPRPVIGAHDTAIAGVRAIADNPTAVLSDLSAYYGGCTTTNVSSPPTLESKICNRYAALGNIRCSSKRIGELASVPSCAAGTWMPVGTAARNGADVMQVEAYCDPARTDGRQAFRFYAHGGEGACIGWQGVELPTAGVPNFQVLASLSPHWEGSCWRSFYVAVAPSAGCAGGACNYTFKFGRPTLDESGAIIDVGPWAVASSFDPPRGITSVADTWDNQCAILEANSGFGACTKVSGPACVDGPSTKTIQGQEVAAPCWEFQSTYRCNDAPAADECAPLAAQGCVRTASACAQALPGDPLTCGIFQDTYQCSKAAQTTTTVSRCGPQPPAADADFARTVAFLEAGREAGRYLDPATPAGLQGCGQPLRQEALRTHQLLQGWRHRRGLALQQRLDGEHRHDGLPERLLDLHLRRAVRLRCPRLGAQRIRVPVGRVDGILVGAGRCGGRGCLIHELPLVDQCLHLDRDRHLHDPGLGDPRLSGERAGHRHEARRPSVRGHRRVLLLHAAGHRNLRDPHPHLLLLQQPPVAPASTSRAAPSWGCRGAARSTRAAMASRSPSCSASTSRRWICPNSMPRSCRPCPTCRARSPRSRAGCPSATSARAGAEDLST
ncbi:MAG: conjugal transfer protein TraN [Comamonadaceae bacterium]|nr:conjugal transfer protein TraN [Comamonadaceae bacterium]